MIRKNKQTVNLFHQENITASESEIEKGVLRLASEFSEAQKFCQDPGNFPGS